MPSRAMAAMVGVFIVNSGAWEMQHRAPAAHEPRIEPELKGERDIVSWKLFRDATAGDRFRTHDDVLPRGLRGFSRHCPTARWQALRFVRDAVNHERHP